MKWSFLLFSSFLCLQAIAQYPATGNKMRLGWQTTGDGLVYRGAIGDTATLDPSGINNAWMLLDTANGNLYAYRIKAWRLVSGGGGGGVTMPFDSVTFNINENDASERELKYSEEKGYLQYGGLDSVQIPLLPGIWYVRNDTSVTIPKGMVVRATGTLGASGRIKVKHMIANGTIDAMYVLGIAMQDIAAGADGYVMTQGKIRKINTQAYSAGAVLYADAGTLGGLTQTKPTGSNLKLPIAFVVHSASNGTLAVRVSPGTYLRDLHDAYITSPASNASLYYNTSESVWRDTGAAVLVADTAAMLSSYISNADTATMLSSYISNADTSVFARDFQISGTANYLAKFTGSNTVGNSVLFEDALGDIGVGTTDPSSFGDYRFIENTGRSLVNGGVFQTTNSDKTLIGQFYTADGQARLATNTNHRLAIWTNNTQRMLFDTVGNVGIGTASPLSTPVGIGLTLGTTSSGRSLYMVSSSDGNNGLIQFKDLNGADALQIGGTSTSNWLYGYGSRPLRFFTNATERMRIDASGNVGIGTASPARILHVAGTTAIRIPVGTTADRGTSGNGDIRYNTSNTNFEWYSGSGWREPVNAARSPNTAGLANRFSKFNASGLLDTSAVLVQSGNSIGINTTSFSGANLVIKNSQEPTRATLVSTQTFGIPDTTNWTAGAGWVLGDSTAKATSANGNLTYKSALTIVGGLAYEVTYSLLNYTSGSISVGVGDTIVQLPLQSMSTNTLILRPNNSTGGFRFIGSNFTGRLDNISLIQISNLTPTIFAGQDNDSDTLYSEVVMPNRTSIYIGGGGKLSGGGTPGTSQATLNIGIGSGALRVVTIGAANTAIGSNALQFNTLGVNNLAVGVGALDSNTVANLNTAIGNNALKSVRNSSNNLAIGADALRRYKYLGKIGTATGNNTAIGSSALTFLEDFDSSTVAGNTAIGGSAMIFTRKSNECTAIGVNAMRHSEGTASLALGNAALSGLDSTAVRYRTGVDNNVAIGCGAMQNIVQNATGNTAIGRGALGLSRYEGDNGVYIGLSANASGTTVTNEIVIGANTTGNGSNTTTIGNSNATATIFQHGETRLGMAADSGAYRLQVNGDTKLIGNLARKKPVTIAAATYTVLSDDSWLICNHTAPITITLPTAANSVGRELMIKYVNGGGATVISSATNISPIVGGALTNIILPATAGSWVTLVCDGANWIIMQKG